MKRFTQGAILITFSLIVSCGGSSDRSSELLDDVLTGPSSVPAQIAQSSTTNPPLDPQLALTDLVNSSGAVFATPVVSHTCGQFALVHKEAEPSIFQWSDSAWVSAPFSYATTFDPEIAVDQHWIDDVTDDGDPEIILNWYYDGGNRSFGQVISASSPDCNWRYLSLVDGFGDSEVIDNLAVVEDGQLGGSGFIDGSGGRVGLQMKWEAPFGLFVAMPLKGEKFCNGLTESFDLPLSNCSEGWAVRMAQESLVDRGAKIDTDGQYGPATQLAILTFQKSLGIQLTGQLDGETWASLFPAGSDEFPDYDGDGVSSPREIGHASGAFEYYGEASGSGARLSPQVTVVRTYCEKRRTALTSDMRGPLIEYLFVTEYSNGRKKIEVVGSSWSTLSGKCG
jgi:hypothetical protein